MMAFQVCLNGKKICCAGVEADGGMSVAVTYSQNKKEYASLPVISLLVIHGGDEERDEYLFWKDKEIHLNDKIEITFMESETVDVPKRTPN